MELTERDREWPFRVVGSDDVEVAGRFKTKEAAARTARQMTGLAENWGTKNKRCRPPYRAQEIGWVDTP